MQEKKVYCRKVHIEKHTQNPSKNYQRVRNSYYHLINAIKKCINKKKNLTHTQKISRKFGAFPITCWAKISTKNVWILLNVCKILVF